MSQVNLFAPPQEFKKPSHWDICENKHGGNEASVAANESVTDRKKYDMKRIYEEFVKCGDRGSTNKEIRDTLKMNYTTVSARCSDLLEDGSIYEDKAEPRRNGCGVR